MNRPATRFVRRSIVATAVGWVIPAVIVSLFPMNGTLLGGPTASPEANSVIAHLVGFIWFCAIVGLWVLPVWLLAVLPLSLFVREDSRFWHPLICGPVGLVAGGAIFVGSVVLLTRGSGELQVRSVEPLAGVACAVGLLTGLVLAYLFRIRKAPIKSPDTTRGK